MHESGGVTNLPAEVQVLLPDHLLKKRVYLTKLRAIESIYRNTESGFWYSGDF